MQSQCSFHLLSLVTENAKHLDSTSAASAAAPTGHFLRRHSFGIFLIWLLSFSLLTEVHSIAQAGVRLGILVALLPGVGVSGWQACAVGLG